MNPMMPPTSVAIIGLLALTIDWLRVGPNAISDRVAFLLALVFFRAGFNGSPLDSWTVARLSELIDKLLHATAGAYVAGAVASVVLTGVVGCLAIYTVGALLPEQASVKMGRFATLKFPTSPIYKINIKLWLCAALLGMLADLPQGAIGMTLAATLDWLCELFSILPYWLFGVK